jgi:tetratricopeptide (TPR) repeat protein
LPLLQGLRPIQMRDVCRLLIPHTKPDRNAKFDEDYNSFQNRILGRIVFGNRDYFAAGLLEAVKDRVNYVEDLVKNAHRPSDSLRRLISFELNLLSIIHQQNDRLEESRVAQQREVEIYRSINDQGNVAVTLNNLGGTLLAMRKNEEARPVLQESLALKEILHGVDSKEVVQTLINLNIAQQALGQLQEARITSERALRIVETHFYEEDPVMYANVLGQNAKVLLAIGGDANLNRATNQVNQAIAIEIQQFGAARPYSTNLLAKIEEKQRPK